MRGCRGRTVEESIERERFLRKVNSRGQTAVEWRKFGRAMGDLMRKHLSLGHCKGCKLWGQKRLSLAMEREFEATWGISSKSVVKESCTLVPETFLGGCPHEVRVKHNQSLNPTDAG